MTSWTVTTSPHSHSHPHAEDPAAKAGEVIRDRLDRLIAFLSVHFGDVEFLSAADAADAIAREVKSEDPIKVEPDIEGPKAEEGSSPPADAEAMLEDVKREEAAESMPLSEPALRVAIDKHAAFVLLSDLVRRLALHCIANTTL